MGDKTGISWTDATWNPIVGCSIVSPACTNCYAMAQAARIQRMTISTHYAGTTKTINGKPVWSGELNQAPEHILTQPLRWKKPRRIFVNSMSDLFHENVPDEWIDRVFAIAALAHWHTLQVLTKRPARMRAYMTAPGVRDRIVAVAQKLAGDGKVRACFFAFPWPLPNVWLGVTTERQKEWDERTEHLRHTPAAVRFVSIEPMLERIDMGLLQSAHSFPLLTHWLGWVICGGESGPNARPMHPSWAYSLRDQCADAGVPFFFKQWGEWAPPEIMTMDEKAQIKLHLRMEAEPHLIYHFQDLDMGRLGKKNTGATLDNREHKEFPKVQE